MTNREIYKLAEQIHKEAFFGGAATRFFGSKFVNNILSKAPHALETLKPLSAVEGAANTTKTMFGMGRSVPALKEVVSANVPNATIGDKFRNAVYNAAAEPIMKLKRVQEVGLNKFLSEDFGNHMMFNKTGPDGVTRQYKRSLPGRIMNYSMSGPGFAAQNVLFKDPNEPMRKTLGRAAFEGTMFTFAPRLGGAYYGAQLLKNLF